MPATTKIAVIESRLPYTDRRALSEAWFSALHLATDAPLEARARDVKSAIRAVPGEEVAGVRGARARSVPRGGAPQLAQAARRIARAGFDVPARRSTDRTTVGNARSTFDRQRSYPPFRTSITLEGVNGTRVHLIVRRVGPTLHVVALCPPAVESLVRHALASAEIHFRARGERLHVDVDAQANA